MPSFNELLSDAISYSNTISYNTIANSYLNTSVVSSDGILSEIVSSPSSYFTRSDYDTIDELNRKIKELERENKILKDIIIEHEL